MTTFSERELSLESHYAHLELLAFQERAHRHKTLALELAEALGVNAEDAELFAVSLAERCAVNPDDNAMWAVAVQELCRHGIVLSCTDIQRLSEAAQARATMEAPQQQSWFEFVTDQILSLFSNRQATGTR